MLRLLLSGVRDVDVVISSEYVQKEWAVWASFFVCILEHNYLMIFDGKHCNYLWNGTVVLLCSGFGRNVNSTPLVGHGQQKTMKNEQLRFKKSGKSSLLHAFQLQ